MLYVALVLDSAWSPLRRSTLRVVAGCMVLTLLGSILPPPGLTNWSSGANLTLVLASIWVAAVAGGCALSLVVMTCEGSFMKAVHNATNQA
jgi:hypothetical protein